VRRSVYQARIEIPAALADATDAALLGHGVGGWSLLEDAIAKRAWIIGIFPDPREGRAEWETLKALLPVAPWVEPSWRRLSAARWRDSYKAHFKAWKSGRLHWVPIWERERFQRPKGHAVLWLDPGMAFGTGNHETTRLCCHRLIALAKKAAGREKTLRVIDAGCGSGILALSAVRLGFKSVLGFDNDPAAVKVSRENAALNGLGRAARFITADLSAGLAKRKAEVILANIQADVLVRAAPILLGAVAPGGSLVLSGILAVELAQVRTAYAGLAPGWAIASRTLREWSDLVLTRPRGSPAPARSS